MVPGGLNTVTTFATHTKRIISDLKTYAWSDGHKTEREGTWEPRMVSISDKRGDQQFEKSISENLDGLMV